VTASEKATQLVQLAAEAASDKLADGIIAYDVSEQLVITDAFVLCSAPNDRQVRSIVDEVEKRLREDAGAKPVRREGEREGRWVLLDFIDIIVHIQSEEDRTFYALDACGGLPADRASGRSQRARRAAGPGGRGPVAEPPTHGPAIRGRAKRLTKRREICAPEGAREASGATQ
jgi:iojap-like ribosome-associated protein